MLQRLRDPRIWLVAAVLVHLAAHAAPAWERVTESRGGRDYASYHYAVKAAAAGHDPYDTRGLGTLARAEGTRGAVHPYFYPPPFLAGMAWSAPLSLRDGARAMFVLNEAALFGSLVLTRRALGAPLGAIALLLATYTPIADNLTMGQANLLALLPALAALAALARRREVAAGVGLGVAGMAKMSPALLLAWVALRGRWRAFATAAAAAVALSLAALPWVGAATQRRFYAEVLPGFARGDYHDLAVPLTLASNHSLPELWARLLPGPDPRALGPDAGVAARLTALALLALWGWTTRRAPAAQESPDGPLAETDALPLGALCGLMVFLPAYTYEHHLVLLIPLVGAGARTWRRGWGWRVALAFAYAPLAMPLDAWRWLQHVAPDALVPLARELKLVGGMGLVALCLAGMRPDPDTIGSRRGTP
ncbi:MAG: hypothetical protein RLZZ299_1878 [Pseudomonadota bacterium]|jgi:hypothetical protein